METPITRPRHSLRLARVVIRGIPKEGWKRVGIGVAVGVKQQQVVIRGIPKEGWKLFGRSFVTGSISHVVIRGIPKEGWKLLQPIRDVNDVNAGW